MKPLSHSSYLRLQVLCKSFYDVEEKQCVLSDLSLADLNAFIPELRSQVCLTHGMLKGRIFLQDWYLFILACHAMPCILYRSPNLNVSAYCTALY